MGVEVSDLWKLRRKEQSEGRTLGSWEASFPRFKQGAEQWELPSYVILSVGTRKSFVKASIRSAGRGSEVFVGLNVLRGVGDGVDVSCKPLSARRFRFHLLLHDSKQRASLMGGSLTAVGILIDGGIAIGKIKPIWVVEDGAIFGAMVLSMVLKVIGLFLVVWRGLLEDK